MIQRSSQWGNKPLSALGGILESYLLHTPRDNPLLRITGTFLYIPGDSESTLYESFALSAFKEVTSLEMGRIQKGEREPCRMSYYSAHWANGNSHQEYEQVFLLQ